MQTIDYLALLAYLAFVLGLGVCFRDRGRSRSEYFLAGRRMGWLPVGLSVMVTVFSAVNYVALPNEVFGYGLYVIAALPVFFLAAWPVTRYWMPMFHALRVTSAHEYLERRFDGRVRTLAGVVFLLWRLFWMATVLFAVGTFLGRLIDVSAPVVIVVAGVVALVYTTLGGMRAVMWTDVAQFCVLFGGILLGLLFAVGEGGFGSVLEIARSGGRLRPFVPFDPQYLSPSPFIRMTLWSGVLGVFVAFLSRYGADQVVMQRYFSARSLSTARRGLWFNAAVSVFSLSLLVLFGLAVYARAAKTGVLDGIDWATLPPLERKTLAMDALADMIRSFPVGVTGLTAAGLLAASMSSIDSGVNACSAVCMTDFHDRLFPRDEPDTARDARLDRLFSIVLGVVAVGLALALIPLVGRTNSLFMIVNKVVNALGSPLLALFALGMFSRRANAPGVLIGGAVGTVASLAISLGAPGLSLQYYAPANLLATLVPCCIISVLAARAGHVQPDERLRFTWARARREDIPDRHDDAWEDRG